MVKALGILAALASISACVSTTHQSAQAYEDRVVYWSPTRFIKSYWSPVDTYTSSFNAAIVDVDDDDQGGRKVTQKLLSTPDKEPGRDVIPVQWSFGPIYTSGSIDTSTYGFKVSVSILGIALGDTIEGNLKDGVKVDFNLFAAIGGLKYYIKNGNEVWINVDVKVKFDGSFSGDYKLISF